MTYIPEYLNTFKLKFTVFSGFAYRVLKQKMEHQLWNLLQVPLQKLSFQLHQKGKLTLKDNQKE